jgi:drug/metabolite transporter (DMT)-like permease
MTTTQWALLGHLVGAFLFVAGAVLAAAASEAARRHRRVEEIAALLGLARVGAALVGGGALLLLPFGLWLVHLERRGYGAAWIDAALGLFVLAAVLGAFGGRTPKRARLLAESGAPAVEVLGLLDDPLALGLNYASAVLVATILVLMVWQPA